jgi:hypothetical protein
VDCHVGVLWCWCIVVLVYCCVGYCRGGALLCWCIVVLVYCRVSVLSCWCIVVLVYCHVSVLSCWCIVMLVYCLMYIPNLPKYLVVVGLLCCYVVGCTYLFYLPT